MRIDSNAGLDKLIRDLQTKVKDQRTEIQQLLKIVGRRPTLTQPLTK